MRRETGKIKPKKTLFLKSESMKTKHLQNKAIQIRTLSHQRYVSSEEM